MSPIQEAGLTAVREIRRNLRSTKGIAMFVLFFLGGALPSVLEVVFFRIINVDSGKDAPEELRAQVFEAGLMKVFSYDQPTAHHLSSCPSALFLFLFKGILYVLPLLILLIGFEQIAGEIQHRSIRYLAGRARRSSIVVGKALGVWAVVGVMTGVLHLTVWIVILIRGGETFGNVLSWGSRLWVFAMADAAAYVGLTALISACFRTPIVAMFVGFAAFFAMWLTSTILGVFDTTRAATWAFPGTYERLLSSPEPGKVLIGVGVLIAWGAIMVTGASLILERRDI